MKVVHVQHTESMPPTCSKTMLPSIEISTVVLTLVNGDPALAARMDGPKYAAIVDANLVSRLNALDVSP